MATPAERASDLIRFVMERLVDEKEEVKITPTGDSGEGPSTVHLEVAPRDLGLVIGKGGRTASSLRSLLALMGEKTGEPVRMTIAGEEKPPKRS